ncbi:hypothetical protein QE152_g12673 [Popillia japonica]|uniref:Uncharacterized protein n=1 Tax=Popillia japonica TaxID=7064 RepID=A0AAW1LR10_POPJA
MQMYKDTDMISLTDIPNSLWHGSSKAVPMELISSGARLMSSTFVYGPKCQQRKTVSVQRSRGWCCGVVSAAGDDPINANISFRYA